MGAIGNTFYSDMLREVACAGLSCRDRKRIMWQITNDRLVHERSQLGCQATPAFDPFVELQRVHHAFKNLCLSSSASGMAAHLKSFGSLGTMLANRVAKLRKLRNLSAHPDVSVYEDVVKFLDSPLLASESSMVDAAVGGVGIAPGLDVSEDADVSDNSGELHGGWNVEELVEMMEFSEAALLQAMAVSDAEHAIAPETSPDQLGVSFVPCADLHQPSVLGTVAQPMITDDIVEQPDVMPRCGKGKGIGAKSIQADAADVADGVSRADSNVAPQLACVFCNGTGLHHFSKCRWCVSASADGTGLCCRSVA